MVATYPHTAVSGPKSPSPPRGIYEEGSREKSQLPRMHWWYCDDDGGIESASETGLLKAQICSSGANAVDYRQD